MSIRSVFVSERPALIAYLVCGDPDLETTLELARHLAAAGCDLLELGIPFSDPVAEGATIAAAQLRALEAKTTTEQVFDLVRRLRAGDSRQPAVTVPVVIVTYANTVFAHGIEAWAEEAAAAGIQGLILPDVPLEERAEFAVPLAACGIELIPLIALTTEARTRAVVAEVAELGFVQLITAPAELGTQLAAIRSAAPGLPVAVSCETVTAAAACAAGADAIVSASSLVELVSTHGCQAAGPLATRIRELRAELAVLR